MALGREEIDAASFAAVRLVSGAVTLSILLLLTRKKDGILKAGTWRSAFFLFAYAICFSFAYLGLTTATGALILFGCVQMTMIAISISKGERPSALEWIGLLVAIGGLVYLVFPGLSSPPWISAVLMAAAGVAWGIYTLRGRFTKDPLADTTGNFIRSVPMVAVAALPFISQVHLSNRGIMLAILSGSVASGIGYTVWYSALKYHTSTRAAVLQLAVPAIAAVGGILFMSETVDPRLVVASALILGGIGLTIAGRKK